MSNAVLGLPPYLQFFDADGNPLAGGKIYTYAAGTSYTVPKATYTDYTGNTATDNPIDLDAAGIPDIANGSMWLIGSYGFVVKDALGNTIKSVDNVSSFTTLAEANDAFFQSFSGDGTTTAFTLSEDLGTEEKGLMVFVNKALQSCVTNGTFATDTGWTKGAGWTIAAGVADAAGAISTALSQTAPVTLVQGQAYRITYTITRAAGGLIPSIGGTSGTERTASGTYNEVLVAGSSQTIAFTGNAFTGTLDNVSINAAVSAGFDIQAPSAFTVSGTTLTFATAPATGTNNIYVFAPSLLLGAASAAAAAAEASATAALASEVTASAAASSAAAYALAKVKWTFDSSTSMADPGTGDIRLNNATIASATAIAISDLSADSGNPDLTGWIDTWDDGSGSNRGTLYIFKDNANFAIFTVSGASVDNTTWHQLTVTYLAGAGTWSNADSLFIGFAASGVTTVTGGITALTGMVTASGSGSVAASLGSFTSAQLGTALTDETGTGVAVFNNAPNLIGTNTNNNAAAGSIGEVIESNVAIGSAVSLVNSTGKTVTSISLTAGDWDVWGNVGVIQAASTTMSFMEAGISAVDNTPPTAPAGGAFMTLSLTFATGATSQVFPVGRTRISIASTTTYYLVVRAAFATSTATAYGYIGARRAR